MPQHLVSLLYGELPSREAQQVKKHLKTCSSCQQAYQELQNTSKLLRTWEDATPKQNFVFVTEHASRWETWKEKIHMLSWGRRLALGIPAAIVVLLVSLAALNVRFSHHEGEWEIGFGLIPSSEPTDQDKHVMEAIDQMQKENAVLFARLIQESEYRQERKWQQMLAQFAQNIESRRQQDLRLVGQDLEILHRTTEGKFSQTSDVLNNLIRMANSKRNE